MRQREEANLPEYPLFTHQELDSIGRRFHALPFGHPRKLQGGKDELVITLHPAGHVAGAAGVEIAHKGRQFFFTGDVLFDEMLTVPGARFPSKKFDAVVIETTRGATERALGADRENETLRLIENINQTIKGGGSCLIPIFALGRMQEMFAILAKARDKKQLIDCPIYAAGLGMDLCDYFDEITRRTGLIRFSRNVLKKLSLRPAPRKIMPGRPPGEPGLYILSSGMLVERTPSYAMAASLLGDESSAIFFVGYCDPDTPGGKLQHASPGEVFVFNALSYQTPVRAMIERFHLSGHADREELLEFAVQTEAATIVLTHGDQPARDWFAKALSKQAPNSRVIDPQPLETYQI
jgi:Cft2 family RNA processing exonuclease